MVAGIVFASQVNSKFAAGDYQGALEASKNAKKWMKWGLFSGIAIVILYVIFVFALGGAAIMGLGN